MPNIELLQRTMAHIEEHPTQWNQQHYAVRSSCGTAYCFAGWACVLSGVEIRFGIPSSWGVKQTGWLTSGTAIPTRAEELLGLDHGLELRSGVRACVALFDGCNSLEDLRAIVDELCFDELTAVSE